MKTTSKNLIDPMEIAFEEAKKAYENNEVPVGAVIADSYGNIISRAFNQVETQQDPTAHAEILAIKRATVKIGNKRLTNCNLYVTLEPCSMCASAIEQSRIKRLYFGCEDHKKGAVNNGAKIFNQKSCNHKPEIYDGIKEKECSNLLKEFFKSLRKNKLNIMNLL